MDHAHVVKTVTDSLRGVPEVRAMFLSGSSGTGHDDACSNIDSALGLKRPY
jgi:hypothetical protein